MHRQPMPVSSCEQDWGLKTPEQQGPPLSSRDPPESGLLQAGMVPDTPSRQSPGMWVLWVNPVGSEAPHSHLLSPLHPVGQGRESEG